MAEAKFTERRVANPDADKPVEGRIEFRATFEHKDLKVVFDCMEPSAEKDALFEDAFGSCIELGSAKATVIARLFTALEAKRPATELQGAAKIVERPAK